MKTQLLTKLKNEERAKKSFENKLMDIREKSERKREEIIAMRHFLGERLSKYVEEIMYIPIFFEIARLYVEKGNIKEMKWNIGIAQSRVANICELFIPDLFICGNNEVVRKDISTLPEEYKELTKYAKDIYDEEHRKLMRALN